MQPFPRLLFTAIILIFTFFMIINPQETINAAFSGFKLWYSILLPALLPFFIASELLVSLGLAKFLGLILEPVMRPLFKLPGCSSLAIVMGFTSGFPVGAVLTKKLYDEKMLTDEEAERLVSFTNNSSPLFIIGAVGVGMLNSPALGYLLAFAHYASNLLVGWYLARKAPEKILPLSTLNRNNLRLFLNLKTPGIGRLAGDAIRNSIANLLQIAGFIIIFSVFARMLMVWGIMDIFAGFLLSILPGTGWSYQAAYGIGMGILEMTIGIKTVSASRIDLFFQLILISLLLSFSGFSIIAQVMSIVAGTKIRFSFYLKARFIQMVFAGLFTYAGYIFLTSRSAIIPSLALPYYKILYSLHAWQIGINCFLIGTVLIGILIIISLILKITARETTP
ncbi:sporulation integral membrane protein YlbJ [Thermosyntropha lipolytica DSM 11003]|uniref:Sporulation integral membrane protein YlbJ n=1 Tax=Thermosyntropha lipolytica DSM 11003 TaxID=1123382 RepID=A0A1M5P5X8_9FIRM|nr:sporulation integral membrane protein YlbJ [Thermosyntropha lipolytica]SHG97196.1 sporulation integral membrane protein YlbJ [Thermosyntropha lipolytica DSM 11003]